MGVAAFYVPTGLYNSQLETNSLTTRLFFSVKVSISVRYIYIKSMQQSIRELKYFKTSLTGLWYRFGLMNSFDY